MANSDIVDARLGRALLKMDTVASVRAAAVVAGAASGTMAAADVMEHPVVRSAVDTGGELLHALAHAVECGAVTAWVPEPSGQMGLFGGSEPATPVVSLERLVLSTGENVPGMVRVYSGDVERAAAAATPAVHPPHDENIYQLHERVLGPFGHSRQQQLALLEEDYPALWIHRAFEIADQREVRNLSYIQGILRSWRDKGPDHALDDTPGGDDRGGYIDAAASVEPFPWER